MQFNYTDIEWQLLSIPVISMLIGWGTNYIAVKMIFRPRKPIRILFFTLHGVVPRRQRELAEKIGETIESNFISHRDIEPVIQSEKMRQEIAALIDQQIDQFVSQQLAAIPMIGTFLQGSLLNDIKSRLAKQIHGSIPELLETFMDRIENNLSFREIVQKKVEEFDLGKLEEIIYKISAKELRAIEYLGGVLGFLVGIIQVLIVVGAR